MGVSFSAAAVARCIPQRVPLFGALLEGSLTGGAVLALANWVGNSFLGGDAHPDPHGWGSLMYEGWGMMMVMLGAPNRGSCLDAL